MEPHRLAERLGRWSSGRDPLYALLVGRLRALIDDGELTAGTPLPADRALATALAVGRNTVVAAYEQLVVEGRIVRRQGSGTRVAGTPAEAPAATTDAPMFLHLLEPKDGVIMLACAASDAPAPELLEAYQRTLPRLSGTTGDTGYHPMGYQPLRDAIAEYYQRRGLPTTPHQILVTTGGQQALSLLARALLRPGDRVLVQAPTYPGALEAFREEGALPRGLPVDFSGFTEAATRHRPALAYLISTYHNPTAAVLPAGRREEMAHAAAGAGVPLIDDEVPLDLGFPDEQVPPPVATHHDEVITVASLSKVVWGGMRIGWVRAPTPLVTRLARLRAVHDLGGNIPAQAAAADLMPRLDAPRRRNALQLRARHDHLVAELRRHLPQWHVPTVRGGQTLWIRLPHGDGSSFTQTALRHGVAVLPGAGLDADGGSQDHLRLHFLATPDQLTEAVRRLAAAWHDYRPPARPTPTPPTMAI